MAQPFVRVDASNYTSVPRVNARSGVALAHAMLVALPKDAPSNVKHAARHMRADAVALQEASRAGRAAEASTDTRRSRRVVDNEADALHATAIRRLSDFELLATYDPAAAEAAAVLIAALYPRGGEFLRGDMLTQWQATEEWFIALRLEGREKALRGLVGDAFVDAITAVHVEYGEVIGTTKARPAAAPKADLVAPLAALAASTQDLALQLVAFANDRSADPARCAEARAALRPIDDLRAANARRVAHRAPDAESALAETDAPLPAV